MSSLRTHGSAVRLRGLTKRYGAVAGVNEIDLDVEPGEFVSLLGPSGSGKTTTLMLIGGFIAPDRGEILIDGQSVAHVPPYKRDLGIVFQNYALFPHMTVGANLAYPLEMRKIARREIERRVAEVLDLVRLPVGEYGRRYPRQLSGGQQQRVAVARALVYRPRVLLMDEPLGALDKKLRGEMQLEIKRVHAETRTTVLYVTHDQEEALVLSDRVAVFRGGRVEQLGAPVELYERPATRFVADFIGESNLLEGMVEHADAEGCSVRAACGLIRVPPNRTARPGLPVSVVVRPENVFLVRAGEKAPDRDSNVVDGIVESAIYVGEGMRYLVRLLSGDGVRVKEAMRRDLPSLVAGDPVQVGWSVVDGVLLPGRPEAGA